MQLKERLISVFLLVVCAVWLIYSRNISGATMPGTPGPKFFPFVVVGILAFLTILNEVLNIRAVREKQTSRKDAATDRRKVLFSFVLIFLYVVGIDLFGFYPATSALVFCALKGLIRIAGWLKPLAATVLITGSVFVIFTLIFQLSLPRGVF
jgi:hypothetical protein